MSLLRKLILPRSNCYRHLSQRYISSNPRHFFDSGGYTAGDTIVRSFAAKPENTLSLSDIIHFTGSTDDKFKEFGIFLWNELPIRISHRIVELSGLPYNLSMEEPIRELRELYTHSFHLFRMLEAPNDSTSETQFISEMINHFNSLKPATILLANALNNSTMVIPECPFLNGFLDRFHAARIGTRLLTGQYITCLTNKKDKKKNKKKNDIGLIDFNCSPKQILEAAIDDAQYLCHENFGMCPQVNITLSQPNITFPYIPSDLHYIFFELMKNSMRAVCDKYNGYNEDDIPPIECVIVASQESDDVTIKISDQGDGISKENINKIWYYSYTTIDDPKKPHLHSGEVDQISEQNKKPMHGFGYGLPLSRLYARYFGGDLKIISMDGYGTDAFIYLNWLKPDDVKPLIV